MPPLLCPWGGDWGGFKQGKALPPGDCLNCVRVAPGFNRVEHSLLIKAEPTGVFGRYWVLFTLELPQSSFTRILRKWQAGRAPLNSPPSKGRTSWMAQERMNAEWMWNEAMAVETLPYAWLGPFSPLPFLLFLFFSVFKAVIKPPQLSYLFLCFCHNKPSTQLTEASAQTSAYIQPL